MPKLSNKDLIVAIARNIEPKQVVVGNVDFRFAGSTIGNRNPKGRVFSQRPDVQDHFHVPGEYFCGRCMLVVRV